MKYKVKKLSLWIRLSQSLLSVIGILPIVILALYAIVYTWLAIFTEKVVDFVWWWPIFMLFASFVTAKFTYNLIHKTLVTGYYSSELSIVRVDVCSKIAEILAASGDLRPIDKDKISILGSFEKNLYRVSEVKVYLVETDTIKELTYRVEDEKLYLHDEFIFSKSVSKFLF